MISPCTSIQRLWETCTLIRFVGVILHQDAMGTQVNDLQVADNEGDIGRCSIELCSFGLHACIELKWPHQEHDVNVKPSMLMLPL